MTKPYAYPHLNSVMKYGDSYLLSSRYIYSIFFIDQNSNITWHLHGQTGGDFQLAHDTSFCFQHDPRFINQTEERIILHMHNNANTEFTAPTSITTGLVLDLDMNTRQVALIQKFWDTEQPVFAQSQGSFQNLTNGHVLLQHGATSKLEEYDENGSLMMRARFGYDNTMQSYRGYRAPWVGRPRTKPDVLACPEQGKMAVYVSWNGATDVQSWKVLAGPEGKLSPVETAPRNGFETKVWINDVADQVIVQAVDGAGDGTQSEIIIVGEGC